MSEDGLTWIKHNGGPMPVPGDTVVATRHWRNNDPKGWEYPRDDNNKGKGWTARFWGHQWTKERGISEYAIVTPSPNASDPVEQPSHYKQGGIECIDAIRAALTPDEFRGYCKGNILKYAWRERHKNGDEDLRKAAVYAGFATDKRNG